jgi:hypothetical protein
VAFIGAVALFAWRHRPAAAAAERWGEPPAPDESEYVDGDDDEDELDDDEGDEALDDEEFDDDDDDGDEDELDDEADDAPAAPTVDGDAAGRPAPGG